MVHLVVLSPAAGSVQAWAVRGRVQMRVQTAAARHVVLLAAPAGGHEPHRLGVVAGPGGKAVEMALGPHFRVPLLGIGQRMFGQFGGMVVPERFLHSPLDQFSGRPAEQALLEAKLGLGLGSSFFREGREAVSCCRRRVLWDRCWGKAVFAPWRLRWSDAHALSSVDGAGGEDGGDYRP